MATAVIERKGKAASSTDIATRLEGKRAAKAKQDDLAVSSSARARELDAVIARASIRADEGDRAAAQKLPALEADQAAATREQGRALLKADELSKDIAELEREHAEALRAEVDEATAAAARKLLKTAKEFDAIVAQQLRPIVARFIDEMTVAWRSSSAPNPQRPGTLAAVVIASALKDLAPEFHGMSQNRHATAEDWARNFSARAARRG